VGIELGMGEMGGAGIGLVCLALSHCQNATTGRGIA